MKKTKMAAIGEQDIMLIFKAIGVDVFPAAEKELVQKALKEVVKADYGICFITETMAMQVDDMIREYSTRMTPSIVVVPGIGEKNNYAIERLRQSIVKAVGADIISEK